jgi:hypothetical protein
METKILRVVRQGEAFSVQRRKAASEREQSDACIGSAEREQARPQVKQESGSIQKCNIVLREMGGSKFENEYVCAMLGNLAACRFYEGDVVVATLRFSTHEYQGQVFQEILVTDMSRLSPGPSL